MLEVRDDHLVNGTRLHRLPVGLGQLRRLVGTVSEVGAQVDTLDDGVDDVAVGVEQHHVVETEPGDEVSEELLIAGVELGPFAGIAGRGDLRRGDEIPVGRHRVRVLQIGLRVRRGSEQLRVDLASGALGQRGSEHIGVVSGHGLLCARRQRGLLQCGEGRGELPDGVDRGGTVREDRGGVDNVLVEGGDLPCA